MGGRIARNFALRHPHRLRSLVLAGTSPGLRRAFRRRSEALRRRAARTRRRKACAGCSAAGRAAGAYEQLLDSVQRVHQASFEKTLEASVAQDRAAPIEQITLPTLVITGDEDTVYPPALAQRHRAAHSRRRAGDDARRRPPQQPRAARRIQPGSAGFPHPTGEAFMTPKKSRPRHRRGLGHRQVRGARAAEGRLLRRAGRKAQGHARENRGRVRQRRIAPWCCRRISPRMPR